MDKKMIEAIIDDAIDSFLGIPPEEHLSSAEIVAMSDGILKGEELADAEFHIAECNECSFLLRVANDGLEAAQEVERLINLGMAGHVILGSTNCDHKEARNKNSDKMTVIVYNKEERRKTREIFEVMKEDASRNWSDSQAPQEPGLEFYDNRRDQKRDGSDVPYQGRYGKYKKG